MSVCVFGWTVNWDLKNDSPEKKQGGGIRLGWAELQITNAVKINMEVKNKNKGKKGEKYITQQLGKYIFKIMIMITITHQSLGH